MAALASLSVPFGAESTISPVAGLITLYVCPEFEPTDSPAMNILAMASPYLWVTLNCSIFPITNTVNMQYSAAHGTRVRAFANRQKGSGPAHKHGLDVKGNRRAFGHLTKIPVRPGGGQRKHFSGAFRGGCRRAGTFPPNTPV